MGILDSIKEAFYESIRTFSRNMEKEFSRAFLQRIYEIKKQIIKDLLAVFIILIAIALLSASAVFFLIEYLHLTKTISLLIIGIIVLFIGIVVKLIN